MSEPAPVAVRDALDELVNQFADPMSFLRELIQNAIDAGSEEIEVSVDFEPGKGDDGVTIVRVDDWGEGMTREIVEKRLTRLFSSAKDGDMTKIGKFGIGFVSVFAIEPEAVCVDTAREGEAWRVLFDSDRRYRLIKLDEPVDGTKIQIIKKTTKVESEALAARARRVVDYWCKHVQTEIRFAGELVRQPFDLPDAIVRVERDDGFSQVVVGHSPGPESFAGFYNSGLTLDETEDPDLPGIAYKVSSPHLEHTLTRDAVIRDAGYERVMEQVHSVLAGPLVDRVLEALGKSLQAAADSSAGKALPGLWRAATRHALMGHLRDRQDAELARTPGGRALSVRALARQHKEDRVLVAKTRSHLTDALEEDGHTVIVDRASSELRGLLAALSPDTNVSLVRDCYCLPVTDPATPATGRALAQAVRELLRAEGSKVGDVGFGRFDYPESAIEDRVAVVQPKLGAITPVTEAATLGRGLLSRARALTVNHGHPSVVALMRVAAAEPEFAAYVLVKGLMLGHHLDAALDSKLLGLSVEARWRRSTT